MYYSKIKYNDIANGTGVRTVLFVSGCTHECEGCFQPETWNFRYGSPFTDVTIREITDSLEPSHIAGLTLLGGEPMEPDNQRALIVLLRKVKEKYPQKDIWCYTGYTYETDLLTGRAHCEVTDEMLSYIDILVDGEFIEEKKDITLEFRGSSNQRILHLKREREGGLIEHIKGAYDEWK
ncbi:MAG: anaerobic ribonucleoside-triphosphate reductase activating protein [Lachnospiraceae bacterium]|nr:anaerobic ribonucleoside-triphosphate reductase activating protein [Lachnospiraceae bacterium]